MITELHLFLPFPPRQLHPNYRGSTRYLRAKNGPVARYRRTVAMLALAASRCARPRWTKASAQLIFWLPDHRHRDIKNLEAWCKAGIDGIVDAGIIADDCADVLTWEPSKIEYEKNRKPEMRVEFLVREVKR